MLKIFFQNPLYSPQFSNFSVALIRISVGLFFLTTGYNKLFVEKNQQIMLDTIIHSCRNTISWIHGSLCVSLWVCTRTNAYHRAFYSTFLFDLNLYLFYCIHHSRHLYNSIRTRFNNLDKLVFLYSWSALYIYSNFYSFQKAWSFNSWSFVI